jgi:hypothetical protein
MSSERPLWDSANAPEWLRSTISKETLIKLSAFHNRSS